MTFFCHFALSGQQYYIKGQIKDDKGFGLGSIRIALQANDIFYETGGDGLFNVPSSRQSDTLIIFLSDDTVKTAITAREFNKIIIPAQKLHLTKTASYLSSLSNNLEQSTQQQYFLGNETYSSLVENKFIRTENNPSTEIALNYNRAPYSNIRRF